MSPPAGRVLLSGFGRAAKSAAERAEPENESELADLFASAGGRGLIARGLGSSYGDAAQCAGGSVLATSRLSSLSLEELASGRVRAGAGLSLEALLAAVVPRGRFVMVTPGTRKVSVGGAVAADVHGKNHHLDGSFCEHVDELVLVSPSGRHVLRPGEGGEFEATAGGMGLTGVVTEASLRLLPIETSRMVVDTERPADLEACLEEMASSDDAYRYSVAWVDALARGRRLGRAVLTRANHAPLAALAAGEEPLAYAPRRAVRLPLPGPLRLLNPASVAAFNVLWFHVVGRPRREEVVPIPAFFHPLDGAQDWNLLYGRRGFTQYQLVVPFGAEGVLFSVLEAMAKARACSFLAVLKRFGPAGGGLISFPMPGWTLALDLPLGTPGLGELLDRCDELVAEAGGRVYLAKDGRLRPELVAEMYPGLAAFLEVRERLDPNGVLQSDLSRRLGLAPRPAHRTSAASAAPEQPAARAPEVGAGRPA